MKMTIDEACKTIKLLLDEKDYIRQMEDDNISIYSHTEDDSFISKELFEKYFYNNSTPKIAEIDRKIAKLRHAVNADNVTSRVVVEDREYTVDELLILLPQLYSRVSYLKRLRTKRTTQFHNDKYCDLRTYDPEVVAADYLRLKKRYYSIQVALDRHNATAEIEVEL